MRFVLLLFISGLVAGCGTAKTAALAGVPGYVPADKALHDTITRMDSIFFEAYNECRLDTFASLVSEDLEFYHDRGGLSTSKPALVESIRNNICGKVRRELLPGSIEVYPVPNYGAVQMGAHRFFNNRKPEAGWSRYAKFVTIWKWEANLWRITRVISLH